MARFKIPSTAKGVTEKLGEIGKLLTATEWTKAALLASIVRLPGSGGNAKSSVYTAEDFAALGITGLRSKDTVRLYVRRWLDANDGLYPQLGANVTLPNDDWPPTRTGTDGYESEAGAERTIERLIERHGAEIIARAVTQHPSVANAVLTHVVTTDREPHPRGGGGTPLSPVVDALQQLLMTVGARAYVHTGKVMYEALLARAQETLPWRPGEIEAVVAEIEAGLAYGRDAKALLTPVSDEDLAELLGGGKG